MSTGASFTTVNSFDLDHYRAQPGNWNVQADQLSRGTFRSQIRSLQYDDLIAYDNRWGAASLIRGESPEGWMMFGGIITPRRASVSWCGQIVDDRLFACTPERQAIEFAVESGAHDVVLLAKPELLAKVAGDVSLERIMRPGAIDFQRCGVRLLQVVMQSLLRLEKTPDLVSRELVSADIRSAILAALESCFRPLGSLDAWTLRRSRREDAFHAALEHVLQSTGRTSALEMANVAGVSQKTLELAFMQTIGMTPGKYLRLYRLNQSHRVLGQSDADSTSVTEIALSLGFTHPGRFSAAYKQLFGELPSDTLLS